jgi:Putative zinc-finger
MSHLDEGTLHALLDGELDLAEVSEVQRHLGTCVTCGSRLQEVKQVLAEADRLVRTMEVPAAPRPAREATDPPPPPPLRSDREPSWDQPPVLLVPDPVDPNLWRRRWLRGLKWAAAITVVVVGGRMVGDALGPRHPMLPERDLTSASPTVPPAVVSAEESRRPEAARTGTTGGTRAARRETPARADRPSRPAAAVQELATRGESQRTDTEAVRAEDTAVDQMQTFATEEAAAAKVSDTVAATAGADSLAAERARDSIAAERAREEEEERARAEEDLATRRAAAAALAELDRERRRQRANAATAALPPPTRPEVTAEPEPAPRPPTLEQRAQIYLRIGLDEAVKHLGGPVHVIEGMTPEFIGLTRTQLIPGTNSNRPVVRVVYLDSRGRLILLDQQRMESGQAPASPSGSLRWTIGDVMLYLRGEPSPEVLRALQARVR